jgi:capsular exopolysaccharide synthesis family protein
VKPDSSAWTLSTVWEAIRKFWLLIVGLTIVGGALGYGLSSTVTPIYQSTATLYFALNQGNSASDLAQGSTYTQNQMLSFAQLATSSRVLEPVIDELELDTTPRVLARSVEVTIPQDTVILQVQASSTDPDEAAAIANAVSDSLTEVVRDVAPKGPAGAATITAQVIDEAVVPLVQSIPNKPRDAALGALLGLVVGVLTALAITLGDTRVRNETVVAQVVDAPLLGSVTRTRGESGLVVAREPLGHTSEEFRRVRAALSYANVSDSARCLLVTSSTPSEGKSTFSSNLALTLAGLQHRVLLIDADLRRPRIADYFGVEGAVGLTTVLVGDVDVEVAKMTWGSTTLDLLTSGSVPPNPAEILTSDAMRELLREASATYDYVVVDSPPVISVADATLIAPLMDGVVVVVDASRTRRAQLANSVRILQGSGARILGVVLNKAKVARRRRSYYAEDAAVEGDARG